ncbi:PfkB family carbohydrate kinase [Cohnella luojiensis]|uniref:Carbohydrate kinase n=1 Tax=Cohnella luojiensis TaxID=652876 RepID=A0A4Y8LYB8_9BACL|nr:PfkB family carbohydrate kinase [Cohnella luojiensis]TFE27238.1 carbohydrate kinase [Cohnella luojiensis]
MYDVIALGELLIDFTPQSVEGGKDAYFQKNPGGAPANVLSALSKQGKKTAFIGKVGNDSFGTYLADVLESNGISTKGLVFSDRENTTLAFVELNDKGDRDFTFYRKPGADMMLNKDEIDYDFIASAKVFHYGSISMTHEPSRQATLKALAHAKQNGVLISFDPNLRLPLWPDRETAKEQILSVIHYADIMKISEEELTFLTGTEDLEDGARRIYEQYRTPLICITLGDKGCFYRAGAITGFVDAFEVQTIDTTGAGDAFLGGVLSGVLDEETQLHKLSEAQLTAIITYGNAMGSLATTKRGGIPSMPDRGDVSKLIERGVMPQT